MHLSYTISGMPGQTRTISCRNLALCDSPILPVRQCPGDGRTLDRRGGHNALFKGRRR